MRSRSAPCGFGCIHEPATGPLKRGPAALPSRPSPAQTLVDYERSTVEIDASVPCGAGHGDHRAREHLPRKAAMASADGCNLFAQMRAPRCVNANRPRQIRHPLPRHDLRKVCCPAARAIRHHRLHSACARDSSRRSMISFINRCNTGSSALCSPSWALGGAMRSTMKPVAYRICKRTLRSANSTFVERDCCACMSGLGETKFG